MTAQMREKEILAIGEPINVERIGRRPREQLSWLVGLVEGRAPQTPEDWGNLRRELHLFAMDAGEARSVVPSFGLATQDSDAKRLLSALRRIMGKIRRREALEFPAHVLSWNASKGGYDDTVDSAQDNFARAVLRGVRRRIRECSHLLKVCQAPAKLRPGRKRKGEPKPEWGVCGRLFVARKRTQLYCSGACLSRTQTRKKRAGKKARKPGRKPVRRRGK